MKKLTSFFSRLAGTVIQAAPAGTVAGALIFYIVAVVYSIMTGDRKVLYTAVGFAVLNAAGIAGAMILKLPENFHKYDQDIIGRNFIGVSKMCRLFSHSLDLLFSHRANAALEELKMLESDYTDRLTDSEKAVVSFYTARCYDLMTYYPNALIYYERAREQGFHDKVLPFLNARCTGSNGDTDEAVKLYTEVLGDENSPFRMYVLTDVGRMYLKLNQPAKAMEWFSEAIEKHYNYAEALGGAAIAQTMMKNLIEGQRLYREALINHIKDPEGFASYFKEVLGSVMLEKDIEKKLGGENDTKN